MRYRIICAALGLSALTANAATGTCDRECLYGVLDRYLAAVQSHDPTRAPLAPNVILTENNVRLAPGDGLWGTTTGLGSYSLRYADPATGSVAYYGALQETSTTSPFAVRLKVEAGKITQSETIVARPQEAGSPFVTADIKPLAVLNEIIPAGERTPRSTMIDLANGYFATLQLNDGKIHTRFSPNCNRRENGFQTTNHPDSGYGDITALGCEAQFALGWYRYDDQLRGRRFIMVDEERGLVLAGGFIDHSGRLGKYRLTDGREVESTLFRHPHSYSLLETFKIRNGQIEQIEAVFTTVPYGMPSPWDRETKSR